MSADRRIILASDVAETRRVATAQRIAKSWGVNPNSVAPARIKIAHQGAIVNRLTEDWPVSILSADAANRWDLRILRARARDLERNGGIAERYLSAVEMNVIGDDGVRLQMKARKSDARTATGITSDFDADANRIIEKEWDDFGKRGNFDVTGKHSRKDFWRLALRTAARDGDALILVYRGGNVPNRWKIAFQLLEGDYIDDCYNLNRAPASYVAATYSASRPAPGNTVRMGIELDQFKRKVACWIFANHPGDYGVDGVYAYDGKRLRIPILGTEPGAPVHCIHLTRTKRAEETRGVPWISPAMMDIKMLDGYEEAELVAARAQACKHVFYERDLFNSQGDQLFDNEDASGQLVDDMEPGGATELPAGYKANFYNPTHPNLAYPDFVKSRKRRISAALNCAYNTLFVDLESVNYSSIRAGLLDEREGWKMCQSWLGDDLVTPSFEPWLQMGLMSGVFGRYGITDFDRLNAPELKFRRWPWVDPVKDIRANAEAIAAKITTWGKVISDQSGGDFEDFIDQYAMEQDYMRSKGVDPAPISSIAEQIIDPNVGDNADPSNPQGDSQQAPPAAPTRKPVRALRIKRADGTEIKITAEDETVITPEVIK
jgi:lambda family phage portal protein